MSTLPASKRLLRLISARNDMGSALDAFVYFMAAAGTPAAEHFFFAMVVAYGRPFTENYGLGPIKCEYPSYPDFPDPDLNLRHQRMIDIRNKFLAHSSAEGTRVMVIPPGVVNPITGETLQRFDHNVGKRTFLDPRYAKWLSEIAYAFKGRLDQDVRTQLEAEFSAGHKTEVFELKTGWGDFSWTHGANQSVVPTPGQRPPAAPSPSSGAPQL